MEVDIFSCYDKEPSSQASSTHQLSDVNLLRTPPRIICHANEAVAFNAENTPEYFFLVIISFIFSFNLYAYTTKIDRLPFPWNIQLSRHRAVRDFPGEKEARTREDRGPLIMLHKSY